VCDVPTTSEAEETGEIHPGARGVVEISTMASHLQAAGWACHDEAGVTHENREMTARGCRVVVVAFSDGESNTRSAC